MKITRIEPILFDAGLQWESVWCFVRVETDEGISGIGACSPNVLFQERPVPLKESLQQRELLTSPLQLVEGSLLVPDGPGLGITLNEEVLAAHRLPFA